MKETINDAKMNIKETQDVSIKSNIEKKSIDDNKPKEKKLN